MSYIEVLESELRTLQIELTTGQMRTLVRYCAELSRWNRKINLTGLSGPEMVRRLVVEPVWIGLQLEPHGVLADIGSGNGSPAIPLHVVCSFEKAHLIESRAKRAAFLRHLTTTLPLDDIAVHRARLESMVSELGSVDWISLQGVALESPLINSIREIASATTTIVWISSADARTTLRPFRTLQVPFSTTEVFLFRLDLS